MHTPMQNCSGVDVSRIGNKPIHQIANPKDNRRIELDLVKGR
jgi:hypothetical protein